MNYVWPSIALRAPCAVRPLQRTPLLQLFNGYTRQNSTRCRQPRLTNSQIVTTWSSLQCETLASARKAFSTTSILEARGKAPPAKRKTRPLKPSLPWSASKLEPAPTSASHTEGKEATDEKEEPLTWRDYDPAGGMPLPDGKERSRAEINTIFSGSGEVNTDIGNYVLNVMYWRRMSGALMDTGLDFPQESGVTRDQALKGLEYVRNLQPGFNEQEAGEVWVEEESLRLQQQIQERALRLGIYKRDEPEPEPEEELQGTEYGRERTGESQLVKIRQTNEALWEKEQAERAAAERRAEASAVHAQRGPLELSGGVQPATALTSIDGTGISISSPQDKAWLAPVERKPWVKYYEDQALLIKDNSVPQMSLLRRLGPSLVMLLATLLLADFLSENYTPPPRSARLWPDQPPAVATLTAITGTLALFFVCARFPPLWRTYSKYFTVVPAYPYALGLMGAIFRHDTLNHLAINLASLWLFGLILHDDVGRGTYLSIFLSAGVAGGFSSLAYHVFRHQWTTYMFGASGAILGTVGAACVLRPNGTLKVWGQEIPIAAWVFAALYVGSETFAVLRMKGTGVDHMGHLGGLAAGMAMAGWFKWKASRDGRVMKEVVPEGKKVVEAGV